MILSEVILWK